MNGVLEATLSREHAMAVRAAMTMLAAVPVEELLKASDSIARLTTTGPMLDPTAWLDGTRARNADEWLTILARIIALRRVMPELPEGGAS